MDWLNDSALTSKRKQLKPAETRVTTCEGKQYVESREALHSNIKQSFSGRPPNLVLRPPSCSGFVVDNKPDLHVGVINDHLLIGKYIELHTTTVTQFRLIQIIFMYVKKQPWSGWW